MAAFVPKFLAFLAVLLIGYHVVKAVAKIFDSVLERVGFDKAVERGGVKKALASSKYDASSIVSKIRRPAAPCPGDGPGGSGYVPGVPPWLLLAQSTDSGEAIVTRSLTARDWLTAAAIVLVGFAVGRIVKTVVSRAAGREDDEASPAAAEAVGRVVGFTLAAVSLVYALGVIGVRLAPLIGALGIGGLALAFAGQSILANFLSSIILQLRRPFRRGDQVTVAGCEGTVDDVNFRTVALRTFDGERVLVPCAAVLSANIVNHTTLGSRRTTLAVSVAYKTDLDEARSLLLKAVAAVDGVLERPPPEVWVETFADSGISIAVRFWHAPDIATLWRARSEVAVAAKRALEGAGIEIPFPQRVLRFATDTPPPDGD